MCHYYHYQGDQGQYDSYIKPGHRSLFEVLHACSLEDFAEVIEAFALAEHAAHLFPFGLDGLVGLFGAAGIGVIPEVRTEVLEGTRIVLGEAGDDVVFVRRGGTLGAGLGEHDAHGLAVLGEGPKKEIG